MLGYESNQAVHDVIELSLALLPELSNGGRLGGGRQGLLPTGSTGGGSSTGGGGGGGGGVGGTSRVVLRCGERGKLVLEGARRKQLSTTFLLKAVEVVLGFRQSLLPGLDDEAQGGLLEIPFESFESSELLVTPFRERQLHCNLASIGHRGGLGMALELGQSPLPKGPPH